MQITSQSFLNAIKQRYAERLVRKSTSNATSQSTSKVQKSVNNVNATHEINISAIEEDSRVFHGILAHYYLKIVQDVIAFHDKQNSNNTY